MTIDARTGVTHQTTERATCAQPITSARAAVPPQREPYTKEGP